MENADTPRRGLLGIHVIMKPTTANAIPTAQVIRLSLTHKPRREALISLTEHSQPE